MGELGHYLSELGYHVLILELHGHGKLATYQDFKQASLDRWLSDFSLAFELAEERASGLPLFFLGYSVSAVVALQFMKVRQSHFTKMILLAPAVRVRNHVLAVKPLIEHLPWIWIPSINGARYRAHRQTPKNAYRALFCGMDDLTDFGSVTKIPTLCFLDSRDELVGSKKILSVAPKSWKIVVFPKAPDKVKFHHLFIDASSAGPSRWQIMKTQIAEFLGAQ